MTDRQIRKAQQQILELLSEEKKISYITKRHYD